MTRRLLLTLTLAAATAACAPVAAADAAKPAPYPSVSKVEPLNLGIGDTLKLTGKNFTAGKNKNTVVFKRDGKKAIFVKAHAATKRTLSVVVPEKLRNALGKRNGAEVPTRFRLRVLSRRFAKGYTALKSSPTIAPMGKKLLAAEETKKAELVAAGLVAAAATPASTSAPTGPADCDKDGTPDSSDTASDNDGLSDTIERELKTDPCNVDSDGDGMEDGWEYKSAFDLNRESCGDTPYPVPCEAIPPARYPVKKPYPNPLDGGDAGTDFDGDWLTSGQEHQAWRNKVGNTRDLSVPLWYSEGLRASIDDGHSPTCRGLKPPPPFNQMAFSGPEYKIYSLDEIEWNFAGNGCLDDAERDEDNDFLGNYVESGYKLSGPDWWVSVMEEPAFRVRFVGTDWLDQDSDGDGIVDGKDDQDHDDFWNIEEIVRGPKSAGGPSFGLWVDPFNPCLPSIDSRTCPGTVLVGSEPWRPFYKDTPPEDRWPLYGPRRYAGEDWLGTPVEQQTLPAVHPLPRCFGDPAPGC